MNIIARNAIYAATVMTLWPFALYASPRFASPAFDCPPLSPPQLVHGTVMRSTSDPGHTPDATAPTTPEVRFQMHAGRLKPQLERLLRQHMAVQHIVWQVADEYEWPSTYLLEEQSWPALTESLLAAYQLRMQLFANHSAVITYLPTTNAPGRGGL